MSDESQGTQRKLLFIIDKWDHSSKPEYRGFRCADCQEYLKEAWYYWLHSGGYKTPVHFCNPCREKFEGLPEPKGFDPQEKVIKNNYSDGLQEALREAVSRWDVEAEPVFKEFTCDKCDKGMTEAWHVWYDLSGTLVEVHFCKECGNEFEDIKH